MTARGKKFPFKKVGTLIIKYDIHEIKNEKVGLRKFSTKKSVTGNIVENTF